MFTGVKDVSKRSTGNHCFGIFDFGRSYFRLFIHLLFDHAFKLIEINKLFSLILSVMKNSQCLSRLTGRVHCSCDAEKIEIKF
jgi:hypothetical protein